MSYQSKFWNNYFKYYDVLLEVIPYQDLMKKLVLNLKLTNESKLLDLGSGTGNIQYYIKDNVELINLDYSKEALERLSLKFPNNKTIYHSIKIRLPFEDNTFDRLVSNNVLYTLNKSEWNFTISEIKRIVKPDGIIVISNLNSKFKAINIYRNHIQQSIKKKGFINTTLSLAKLLFPTIQMFKYNKIISKNNDRSNYSFLINDQQVYAFESQGFIKLRDTQKVYANQANLDVFVNKKKYQISK